MERKQEEAAASSDTFAVQIYLARKAFFGTRTTHFDASFEKWQIKEHVNEYLSPYQADLLRESIANDEFEIERFFSDMCRHNSAYNMHFNEKDVLGCCKITFTGNTESAFFSYLCEVLKIPNPKKPPVNMKDYDV